MHLSFDAFLNGDGRRGLPSALNKDEWWFLKANEHDLTNELVEYWRPTGYDSDAVVIQEAMDDVCRTLETHLFKKGGYIS